ncbi:hypothetical protein V5O48_008972, partial [Marasmius crinis-equi]
MSQETHKAVRWHPPSFDIRVEDVEMPQIEHPDDVIVKVKLGGLCGSDLHIYRGHGGIDKVHTCGHEFIGTVVKVGESYGVNVEDSDRPSLYSTLKVGDRIVAPFTVSCGECQFVFSSLSESYPTLTTLNISLHSLAPALVGGQAQYVRVPKAGATLFSLEEPQTISKTLSSDVVNKINDASLLLLSDILPTGLFGALQVLNHPKVKAIWEGKGWPGVFFNASRAATSPTAMNWEDTTLTLAL